MTNEILLFGVQAFVFVWVFGGVAFGLAKGLPPTRKARAELSELILELAPLLRRLFDPNTALANALKAKGIDPAIADAGAELGADVIESLFVPKTIG